METVTLHPSPEALPALQLRAEEPPRPTAKAHSAGPGDRPFPAPTRKPPRGGEAGRLRDHRVPAWSPAGPHPTPPHASPRRTERGAHLPTHSSAKTTIRRVPLGVPSGGAGDPPIYPARPAPPQHVTGGPGRGPAPGPARMGALQGRGAEGQGGPWRRRPARSPAPGFCQRRRRRSRAHQ